MIITIDEHYRTFYVNGRTLHNNVTLPTINKE